jgi:uncharacterized protein (TIGR04255 family)
MDSSAGAAPRTMETMTALPAFESPPVTEVVVSVQFEPLPKFAIPQMGLLWQRFRAQYPRTEQHPALPSVVERLGIRSAMEPQFRFEVECEPTVRLWFLNEAGNQLVQVQGDRFIRNWRRVPNSDGPYPRFYNSILPRFTEDYRAFCSFLQDEQIGQPSVNQVEVSYINNIVMSDAWRAHADLGRMFRGWSCDPLTDHTLEAINLRASYLLQDTAGDFVGRLHAVIQSGYRSEAGASEDEAVFVFTLTARGRPLGEGEQGMLAFVELAHREIVVAFEKMTTNEAHAIWRKKPV